MPTRAPSAPHSRLRAVPSQPGPVQSSPPRGAVTPQTAPVTSDPAPASPPPAPVVAPSGASAHDAAPAATEQDAVVSLGGVSRDYGDGVGVFDIDLMVPPGTILGIVGPSGAGKTTTIRLITG